MKRILFLMATLVGEEITNRDWTSLRDAMPGLLGPDCQVEMAMFGELAYLIDGENSKIWHPQKGWDASDFDVVVFRRVGLDIERASSIAYYLQARQKRFIDQYILTPGRGKLAGGFMRAASGLPVPKTFFGSQQVFQDVFSSHAPLDFPLVLKADNGRKGRDNYLIHSQQELMQTLTDNSHLEMIAQAFVPNDGDLRVLVFNGKIRMVILRKGKEGSHLNNTSQGGSASLLPLESLTEQMQQDCIKGAELDKLQVAGVDLVVDKHTGKHYLLEVNRAPQLATGAFVEQKLEAYGQMIAELARDE